MVLLKNWLAILAFACGVWAGATGYSFYALYQTEKLRALFDKDMVKIKSTYITTEEIERGYRQKIADLNAKLAAAKRVQPSRCVVVHTAAAPVSNTVVASSPVSGHDERGIDSDWLLDFAARADQVAIDQTTCVDFLDEVYALNGHNK